MLDAGVLSNNAGRDSLYISILKSYYAFIEQERKKRNESIALIRKDYPFNLVLNRESVVLTMIEY